ncbi:MAG: GNAT family N-acetyltransferase [Bacteroidales bacterium]|nr:GNAT family N-acetyltransferase [Bacteroidales bacterium]
MKYQTATLKDLQVIFEIVQETIKQVYPKYYPTEVVNFFLELHSLKNIEKDIVEENVGILINENIIVGTGCYIDNHITRVYVLPKFQGKGYGTFIMNTLEKLISLNHNTSILDASLPASYLYEKLGYKTIEHCKQEVENQRVLVYEVMEKKLLII